MCMFSLVDPKVELGDSCVAGVRCVDNNAACIDGLCQCKVSFGLDITQDKCGK